MNLFQRENCLQKLFAYKQHKNKFGLCDFFPDRSSMTRWTFVSILADRGYYSYGHLVLYTDHEVLKVSGGIFGGTLKN